MGTLKRSVAIGLLCLASVLFAPAAFAERLTWRQHHELFLDGTITDDQGRTWRIRIIPGAHRIDRGAVKGWNDAGKLIDDLWDGTFYSRKVYRAGLRAGFRFSSKSLSHFWFQGIGRDYNTMRTEKAQLRRGDFGATLFKIVSDLKFGLKVGGRTAIAPIGAGLGSAYGLLAPAIIVASRPVGAGLVAAFPGALVPATLYVWNGTGWVTTYFSSVPVRENVWVKLSTREKEFVIDLEGFTYALQGTTLATLHRTEAIAIENHIRELSGKLKEDHERLARRRAELHQSAAYTEMQTVLSRARSAERSTLGDDAKAVYLDEVELRQLVRGYLAELQAPSLSEAQVGEIVEALKKTIDGLVARK